MSFSCLKICVALIAEVSHKCIKQQCPKFSQSGPITFPGTSPVHFAIYLEQVSLQTTPVCKQKKSMPAGIKPISMALFISNLKEQQHFQIPCSQVLEIPKGSYSLLQMTIIQFDDLFITFNTSYILLPHKKIITQREKNNDD